MLKNILNLEGVAVLSKEQQKIINGGTIGCESTCTSSADCPGQGRSCETYDCDGLTIKHCYNRNPNIVGIG